MNNSNPLIPQGSLLEQQNKGRTRLKFAVFCVAGLHVLFFCVVLMVGCKKEQTTADNGLPPVDTTTTPTDTNAAPANVTPPAGSNAIAAAPAVPTPPPTPTPPPPPPAPVNQEYVVTKGDSFYSIAKKFGVKMSEIKAANPGVVPTKLKVGQKLEIPPTGSSNVASAGAAAPATEGSGDVYVVKSGESLTKIAHANGVTVKALRAANDLKTDRIKVGEKLKLPARVETAAAAPPAEPAPTSAPPVAAPPPTPTLPAPTTTPAPGTGN